MLTILHLMILIRICKISLVVSVAFFLFLVVLNNLTDYGSNFLFVENVLGMTTVFEGNTLLWRSIDSPVIHHLFYWSIILWEAASMGLCGYGSYLLIRALRGSSAQFQGAKTIAVAGLVVSMLQWFLAFITVGGEWFTMWQSAIWNGQDAAFRMFGCLGIILLFVYMPEWGEAQELKTEGDAA
jgi:predicted small integral membrane protein